MARYLNARQTAFGLVVFAGFASPAFADSTIHVSLWDKGPNSAMMDEAHPMGMGNTDADFSMAMMGITVDTATVPAGTITFEVVNDSKDIAHEMIVAPVKEGEQELPYLKDENRVDEENSGDLGEVAELDVGKGGSLTVDMVPGTYIVYCNVPGHYMGAMWTKITVTQ